MSVIKVLHCICYLHDISNELTHAHSSRIHYYYYHYYYYHYYHHVIWLTSHVYLNSLTVCKKKPKAGKVSRIISMPIEILTQTRKMQFENEHCQQILLLSPCRGVWEMLWITAAHGRGWKASFWRLKTGKLD